jgi:hypothetical protein
MSSTFFSSFCFLAILFDLTKPLSCFSSSKKLNFFLSLLDFQTGFNFDFFDFFSYESSAFCFDLSSHLYTFFSFFLLFCSVKTLELLIILSSFLSTFFSSLTTSIF